MKRRQPLFRALIRCALVLAFGDASGAPVEALVDPTRPPSARTDQPVGEESGHSRVLQSILIAPGRTFAVIDGETVRVGTRVGEARVVKIDETGVILSKNGKVETLKLFPFAEKIGVRQSAHRTGEERAK